MDSGRWGSMTLGAYCEQVPEGDTVWRAAGALRALDGQLLVRTDFRLPRYATTDVSGSTVRTTVSRGKHLLMRLDNGITIHSHLGMDGSWRLHPLGAAWGRHAHTARVVLATPTTEAVGFNIQCGLLQTADEEQVVGHLGPDLLGDDWDLAEAVRRLRKNPQTPIAIALLEQRNLAGIGNIYKNETCFLAGVNPQTSVGALDDRLAHIVDLAQRLLKANRHTSNRTTTGRRHPSYWVYRRRGQCLRCGTPVRYADIGEIGYERATWWCPSCQPEIA